MITIDQERLQKLVEEYKADFKENIPLELYKWEAVKHFQDNWDLDAEDFPTMLSRSLSKTENLLASMNNYPRRMIKQFAQRFPQDVKSLFVALYDETVNLKERIDAFISGIEQIHKEWDGKEAKNHYHTLNVVSTYLWLRYPDKYYIYKPSVVKNLFDRLGIDIKLTPLKANAVIKTFEVYDSISDYLLKDLELKAMFEEVMTSNCYPDKLMKTTTVDLGYYLKIKKKASTQVTKTTEKKYWMYAPGENASKWSRCQEQSHICIGWDGLGDLSEITSLEDCRDALKDLYNNPDSSFMNDGLAVWEFSHVMQSGDVVYAKHGQNNIIGRGIVKSDYIYDSSLEDFYHIRKIEWTHIGKWELGNIVQKTLTDITKYPDYVQKIEAMILEEKSISDMGIYNYDKKIESYIKLLLENKNLILNGAPGTGKTYLAKQIAAHIIFEGNVPEDFETYLLFTQHCKFTQFHPSYDYTDFVEGLRPTLPKKDGNIGFERKDGLFKDFCRKAILRPVGNAYEDSLLRFKKELKDNKIVSIQSIRSSTMIQVRLNEKGAISVTNPKSEWSCTDEKLLKYLATRECHPNDTYTKTIGEYILENSLGSKMNGCNRKYIFIIDEINRGEISKIFGELFFSVDPGYRGVKGKVQTQYQNLITEDDPFKDGFYIPENVYIIGTMNDIDRSVECMDFAMRRRFTFKEITAEESGINMGLSGEAIKRMQSLNKAISEIEGFNSSFHIGAAYYLGVTDYNELWELKLQGLLKEYLRGMPDAEETLKTLKKAYELSSQNDNN